MAAKLMHAVQYDSYGGGPSGLKHVEIPIPTLTKGKVLVKLEAASLNPIVDVLTLDGSYEGTGTDVAGEIVEVGQDVQKFKVGDKVVALLPYGDGGGLAEYAAVSETSTVLRPPEVSAAEGSGLPMAGLTALQALTEAAGIKLDGTGQHKNILITGASGGVGLYAVQLAKLGNTHVTATCGTRNIELVKSLGADEVLDYNTPDGAALKSPSDRKYDFRIVSDSLVDFRAKLSKRGLVIDLTPGASSLFTFVLKKITFSKKKMVPLMINAKAENLDCLVKLVKEGKLKTVIDSKHPLSKAEDAWAKRLNSQCTGKIIVEP
ncbi:unnamed protein product [Malus baccata var. baccata]